MSNKSGMSQYAENNNIALTEANYNEADALIFAQLSYLRFEDVEEWKGKSSITMEEFVEKMLENDSVTGDNRDLLLSIQNSDRYKNCTISNMAAENDTAQWAAMTININDSSDASVIAMRGTDGTTLGWGEDFDLAYNSEGTAFQKLSKEYLENSDATNIYLTGHSKGGNDVVSAYCMSGEDSRGKVKRIDNFDGPGVCNEFENRYKDAYEELDDKLHNYYPENSIIGLLMNDNPGEVQFIEAEIRENYKDKGILGEHDAHSFKVNEDGSIVVNPEGQSEISEYVDNVVDGSLATLTQYERYCLAKFIQCIGIPGLISGDGEKPYTNSDEIAEEIIEWIYEHGEIPIGMKEEQKEFLEKILWISEIIKMTKNKRLIAVKIIATVISVATLELIRVGLEAAGEWLNKKMEETVAWFNQKMEEIERYFEKAVKNAVEKVKEFKENVKEKIRESWEEVKNWVQKKRESITRKKYDYYKNADFSVNLDTLVVCGDDFNKYSIRLKNYYERVQSIQRNLTFSTSLISSYKFRNVKNELRQEQKACKNMDKAIEKVAKTYRNNENRVKNNARV